jgi:SAM-dependent methyltransferase
MINWKVRYAALFQHYAELCDLDRSILEVGSGTEGIARYLKRHVVGLDRSFGGPVNRWLEPVCGSVLALPFGSEAFDDVVCVDTLEHLNRAERPRAIRELIRVARRRVIISGPAGAFAQWGDAAYAVHISRGHGPVPGWLKEHQQYGIPSLGDLLEILFTCGHAFALHVNEGVIQHYSGLVVDNFPFMSRFRDLHDQKLPLEQPLGRATGDVPYSYLLTIDLLSTRTNVTGQAIPAARTSAVPPSSKAEIFAVGHRLDRMPPIPGIRRILAGARGEKPPPESDILSEDAGKSISHRNPELSEMTAIYWVWKNVTGLDAVVFCHYRRYFDFRQGPPKLTRETRLHDARDLAMNQFAFALPSGIAKSVAEGTIIVARPLDEGIANAEQYMSAHAPDDYLSMVNYVIARHPYLARPLVAHVRDRKFYGNNMFVMRWSDFDRLCQFWFDCLLSLDLHTDKNRLGYQRRVLAFLSERLFDIFMRWLHDSDRRIAEYPLFFLEDSAFSSGAPPQ